MNSSQTVTIILIILYAVFHLVTMILQAAQKRKEQERLRQAAEARKRAAGEQPALDAPLPLGGAGGDLTMLSGPGGPMTAPSPIRTGKPVDDLAARRRAQLEELRARRGARSATTLAGTERPSARTSGRIDSAGQGGLSQPLDQTAELQRAQFQREQQQRQQEQMRRMREQQQRDSAQRQQALKERLRREQARRAKPATMEVDSTATAVEPSEPAVPRAAVIAQRSVAASIRQRVASKIALRDAMVFKEILDPAVSLRPPM